MKKERGNIVGKGLISLFVVFVFASLILIQNSGQQQPLGAPSTSPLVQSCLNGLNAIGGGTLAQQQYCKSLWQQKTPKSTQQLVKDMEVCLDPSFVEAEKGKCFSEKIYTEYFTNCEDSAKSPECYPRLKKDNLAICAGITDWNGICQQQVATLIGEHSPDIRDCDLLTGINKDHCLFSFYVSRSLSIDQNKVCTGIINTAIRDDCYADMTQETGMGKINLCKKMVNTGKRDICYETQISIEAKNTMKDCYSIVDKALRSVCITRFANSGKTGIELCSASWGNEDLLFGYWHYFGGMLGEKVVAKFNTEHDQCWHDFTLNSEEVRVLHCDYITDSNLRADCLVKIKQKLDCSYKTDPQLKADCLAQIPSN